MDNVLIDEGLNKEQFNDERPDNKHLTYENNDSISISKQISSEFDIYDIPFLNCDFDRVYPQIAKILPKEKVDFSELSFENCIACEIICAAICHQMNWDYLRQAVLEKTKEDERWLYGKNLSNISEDEVTAMFFNYKKPERIRANERCKILREVGTALCTVSKYQDIFLNQKQELLPIEMIRGFFLKCSAFSKDPKEKKFQLLLQKLSNYDDLQGLSVYCRPAIDYHLIRCYLRRGLLYPKTKYAEEYIFASSTQRKETTVGALRQLCSELLEQIAWYVDLDICVVNSIEWNIGRSVCTQDSPDCYLQTNAADWLKTKYMHCPFFESCKARQNEGEDLLYINEPEYKGTSY